MKILICEKFPPDIGGLLQWFRISSRFVDLGNDVHVLAWTRQLAPGTVDSKEINKDEISSNGEFSNWDLTMQHSLNFLDCMIGLILMLYGHYLRLLVSLCYVWSKVRIKSVVSARGNDVDQMMFPLVIFLD